MLFIYMVIRIQGFRVIGFVMNLFQLMPLKIVIILLDGY